METTNLAELEYPLGMPKAWVFNVDNEPLLDDTGRPISRFITEFEYTYDEESDDLCNITFQFDNKVRFDLPYFDNDVVLLVQWGFILPTGGIIKSPKRKIAIRDYDSEYSNRGLTLKLRCSDLLAYLKGYRTQTIRKYKNPNAKIAIDTIGKNEDNFLDWLKEITEGKFTATVTHDRTALRLDHKGGIKTADYDPVKNSYNNVQRDATAVPKKFFYQFQAAKTIKGKSKALHQAIGDYLKYLNSTDGPFMMDSTGDNLDIKQRNFYQEPFKGFIWAGGVGDLINFKNKTDTRRIKEDSATNTGVNPYTKETDKTEINYGDSREEFIGTKEYVEEEKTKRGIPNEKQLKQYFDDAHEAFIYNIKNPDNQKELTDLSFLKTIEKAKNLGHYDPNKKRLSLERVTIPATQVLNMPEFQSIADEETSNNKKESIRAQSLVGYAIEKIQRKFEASVEVIGDPSLIKGRTYEFTNLSEKDSGIWYATKVTHKISTNNGYMCDMELLKKPKAVGVNQINYKAKRTLLEETEKVELQEYITQKNSTKHDDEDIPPTNTYNSINSVEDIEERVDTLNADNDFKEDIPSNESDGDFSGFLEPNVEER